MKKWNRLQKKCLRCGWKWFPRKKDGRICPKCKTAYWNVPKRNGK